MYRGVFACTLATERASAHHDDCIEQGTAKAHSHELVHRYGACGRAELGLDHHVAPSRPGGVETQLQARHLHKAHSRGWIARRNARLCLPASAW